MDLLESVRKNLRYEPLKKVDPNLQEVKATQENPEQKLAQAAIPAVLAALIKYSDSAEGVNIMTLENADWLRVIYHDNQSEVIRIVAEYSGVSTQQTTDTMKRISDEAVRVVRENVKTADGEKLRSYMNSQRHSILNHLPAVLDLGHLLNEEAFDDRTNKMEGPV